MNDDDLYRRLLNALDDARDAAKDVLTTHPRCGCAFCREVTGMECTLELFGNALRCRAPVDDLGNADLDEAVETAAEAAEAA
ncbi:MAG TPA: hypothetical protein VN688_04560 [Gemmataceae bacterium]|nr:hypothetical protein [Gemmataceae bacterium]